MERTETNARFQRGTIVKSTAGHDADSFYVVLEVEQGAALIADGRRRKLAKPKRKNIRHLARTNQVVPEEELATDNKIRRVLWPLNFGGETAPSPAKGR